MNPADRLQSALRDVPDFPKPGIVFKDITPILADPELFGLAVDLLAERIATRNPTCLALVESRGFLFGAAVAQRLGLGIVPVRKKGKLPYSRIEETYALEYGTATLELHTDAVRPGDRVAIIDDLLATGGTALAAAKLVERLGAEVVEIAFLIELAFLNGRQPLSRYSVSAPIIVP